MAGHHLGVGTEHEDGRRLVQVIGQVAACRGDALPRCELLGRQPFHHLHNPVDVLRPLGRVDVGKTLLDVRVGCHDDAPRLSVAAGRRPTRGLQYTLEHVVGNRIGPQLAHRTQRAHCVVETGLCRCVAHMTSVPQRTRMIVSPASLTCRHGSPDH